jgi:hypothetical protein
VAYGLLETPQALQADPQTEVGLGASGLPIENLPIPVDRGLIPTGCLQQIGQPQAGPVVIRQELYKFATGIDGFLQAAVMLQRCHQVAPQPRVTGLQRQPLAVAVGGFAMSPIGVQGIAQIVEQLRVCRGRREGFPVGRYRVRVATQFETGVTQIETGGDQRRGGGSSIVPERGLQALHGLLVATLLVEQGAQQIQGVGMIRRGAQNLPIQRFGPIEPAVLMPFSGTLHNPPEFGSLTR